MTYSPVVKEMQVLAQGGHVFPPAAGWIDNIQSSATHAEYDVAALRVTLGVSASMPLFVVFAADGPFWANFNATAAIPSGNTTDGSSSEFSPNQRWLDHTVTKISVISANAQNISMQFYRP